MTSFPPLTSDPIGENLPAGVFGYGADPAKYIVQLKRFERPKLYIPGGDSFEWPLGTEGISIIGDALLAEHRYIGDNALDVQVIHREGRRIEMSGIFPGKTGSANMRELLDLCVVEQPPGHKRLVLPGIFPMEQQVVAANWHFERAAEDLTGSWNYTVTFLRQGIGRKIPRPKTTSPPDNPSTKKVTPKGKASRVFSVRDGYRTLRAIAHLKYKDSTKWRKLYDLNEAALNKLSIPLHKVPTQPLPLGMKIRF